MPMTYLVDVDGEIVGTDLSRPAAFRLAWRHMREPATCVDVCRLSNVHRPIAAWCRDGRKWRAERGCR